MRRNKIILVSLAADEAKIPSLERLLLGSLLVSQIQMAAMAGAVSHPPYLLYMDEAHHFVTTALSKMLSEARKDGLGLVLANQYFHQLTGDTLEALEGNVGAFFAFELGERDAHALSLYMKPEFQPTDLVRLGKYRAAVTLRVNGTRQPAFSLDTLPVKLDVSAAEGVRRERLLRKASVVSYTPKPYSEVIHWLNERYAPVKPASASPSSDSPKKGADEFIEPYAPVQPASLPELSDSPKKGSDEFIEPNT